MLLCEAVDSLLRVFRRLAGVDDQIAGRGLRRVGDGCMAKGGHGDELDYAFHGTVSLQIILELFGTVTPSYSRMVSAG